MSYLQKIRDFILGPPIDSPAETIAPEPEPEPQPDGDGWLQRPNGERYRPVPHGRLHVEVTLDEEPAPRRRSARWDLETWNN